MGMFMCDIPQRIGTSVFFAFQKTIDGAGETPQSEAFFLCSPNLLSCADLSQATWETLPVGTRGLRPPPGAPLNLAEEPHVLQVPPATASPVSLSDVASSLDLCVSLDLHLELDIIPSSLLTFSEHIPRGSLSLTHTHTYTHTHIYTRSHDTASNPL